MTTFLRLLVLGCLLGLVAPAGAQRIISWDSIVPTYDELSTVTPAFPAGGAPFVPWASLAAIPPAIPPTGATAIDNTTGIQYSTDGFTFESSPYPFYPPGPPPPGVIPWTFPIGPVTGMEMDPIAGILWVTDGVSCCGVAPVPGFPVIAAPFLVVGPVPVFAPPLTGLDWDPFTVSLWAVDSAGFIYNFLPGGVFIGPGPPPAPPFPGPPATGLALDKTGPFAGFYVATPGLIAEYLTGSAFPPGAAPAADGLAYHALPATLGGGGSCVAGGIVPVMMPTSPAWSGNPFFTYDVVGFAPGTPLLMVFDTPVTSLVPAGFPFGPGTLFFDPYFGGTAFVFPLPAMPAIGPLTLPVPLTLFPPGPVAYVQVIGLECPVSPWFSLTDCTQFTVSLP